MSFCYTMGNCTAAAMRTASLRNHLHAMSTHDARYGLRHGTHWTVIVIVAALLAATLTSAAATTLHATYAVAGLPMPARAKTMATGWSLGQTCVSTLRRTGSNAWSNAGLWQTYLLLFAPLAPVITTPVTVAAGCTGYVTVADTSLVVAGLKPPLPACPFTCLTYADDPTPIVQTDAVPTWRQELNLIPGTLHMVTYVTSNTFARSPDATTLWVDVIPECTLGSCLLAGLLALVRWRVRWRVLLALLAAGAMPTLAAPIMMNYQGIIEMDGGAYHGPGYFKLAMRGANGTANLWANDGVASGEPLVSVYCGITNGSFRLVIGGYEMMPLQDSIFYTNTTMRLFVWFGRTSHGPFELLADGEFLYTVPFAANARAVGDVTPGAIVTTQILAAVSNQFTLDLRRYITAVAASNTFLLKAGDTCSGTLRVSNLLVDTDVTVAAGNISIATQRRVYFNDARSAYLATATNGALTIYSRDAPALEFE